MTDVSMGDTPKPGISGPATPASAVPAVTPQPVSYRRYALALLVAIYTINFLDRQVVTLLIEPIKNDLHLTDFEVGAMGGLWFALLYTILGIPIARYADKGDRPLILTVSLTIWSGFTVVAGFAQNFFVLALSRMGVGVGEAGCTPTAHSLITDYFPKESRARALAIYSMGISIGSLLGMALGGIIAGSWGWRVAFFIAGAPGLLLAVLAIFTLVEPRRTPKIAGIRQTIQRSSTYLPVGDVLKVLSSKPTFWFFAFAAAFASMVSYSHSFYLTSFFLRNYYPEITATASSIGMTQLGYIGLFMGLAAGIGGVIGSWLGGWWCDRFGTKDLRHFAVLPLVSPFICLPVFWYLISINNIWLAMVLLIIPNIGVAIWYGPVYGGVPGLVPPAMRATAAAVLLFIINLIGLGGGPMLFGLLSDFLANSQLAGQFDGATPLDARYCSSVAGQAIPVCGAALASGLKNAVYLSTAVHILSFGCFFASLFTIRKDMES